MKVSEVTVQSYCDFCSPEKKAKSKENCAVCGADICDNHRYLVPVKRDQPHGRSLDEIRGHAWILFAFDFKFVCPDCSSRTYFDLVKTLNEGKAVQTQRS